MKAVKGHRQFLAEGRQLESAGQWKEAAEVYQQVVDADPGNRNAVDRLLVVYRRMKEYRKELAVIGAAMAAVQQRDKTVQQRWMDAHPGAARLGKEVLRTLGGEKVTAYGTDPLVARLAKRKAFVEKRLGTKGKKTSANTSRGNKVSAAPSQPKKNVAAVAGREAVKERKRAAEERKSQQREKKQQAAADRKRAAQEKKAARQAEASAKRAAREAAAEQKRAAEAEKKAKAHPSLFVVSLRYHVSLEKIDTMMGKHVAFLDKHFAAGDFLVAGRQVPRTGGIILVRAKDRTAVERMMKQDPFVKGKVASVDIVEFVASKMARGLKRVIQ